MDGPFIPLEPMLHPIIALGALLCPNEVPTFETVSAIQEATLESSVRIYDVGAWTGHAELAALEVSLVDPKADQATLRSALKKFAAAQEKLRGHDTPESILRNIERFLPTTPGPDFQAIALSRGLLAITATPKEHAWIDSYLEVASRTNTLVDLTVTVYKLEIGSLKALGIDEAPNGASIPSAKALKAKITALESAEVVSAPRITVNPGARANVQMYGKTAYVKDCEVKLIGDPAREVIDPIIEEVTTGLLVDARALPISDEQTAVHAEVTWTQMRHLREMKRTFGTSKTPVTIQLPELVEMKAAARFDVAANAAILITSIDRGGDGSDGRLKELVTVIMAEQVETLPDGLQDR